MQAVTTQYNTRLIISSISCHCTHMVPHLSRSTCPCRAVCIGKSIPVHGPVCTCLRAGTCDLRMDLALAPALLAPCHGLFDQQPHHPSLVLDLDPSMCSLELLLVVELHYQSQPEELNKDI